MADARFLKPDTLALHAGQHPDPVTRNFSVWALGFRFDIVLRGLRATPMEGAH